jgi:DNA-binding transcriptional ArsR family regulator
MAGTPITSRMAAELMRRTADRFADTPATALDYVADWCASGKTLTALARDLNVSHSLVMNHLRREYGAEVVSDTMRAARETGAHVLVDQGLDIADAATPETAQVARLQVATRQWVAERWNARELAAKPASVAVQVNVGALMLEALRQPVSALPIALETAIVAPANLLTDGKSSS